MEKIKILVINGPNLDMLGVRDKSIYGSVDYEGLQKCIIAHSEKRGIDVEFFQSYCEGEIAQTIAHMNKEVQCTRNSCGIKNKNNTAEVFFAQNKVCDSKFDGIVLNAGAYSHYSYAIRDAIELNDTPIAGVHISDIEKREEFRRQDVLKDVVDVYIKGEGINGYLIAIDSLLGLISNATFYG